MALYGPGRNQDDPLLSEINTTPLVDVMLVLMIIFLITIPVVNSSLQINLPREENLAREAKPETIVVSVDEAGGIYWMDQPVATQEALAARLAQVAAMDPQPEVHIRGDARADYESVGRVVYASQLAGIAKIGFITEPPGRD